MIVIVTTNVAPRIRGFLASCTLEIGPGIYTSPHMTKGVRNRILEILSDWFKPNIDGSIVMTWNDKQFPGGQGVVTLGSPAVSIVECTGIPLSFKPYISMDKSKLLNDIT